MTSLRARRMEVDGLDEVAHTALQRRAAREGVLHATDDLVVVGLGVARSILLPEGLYGRDAAERVGSALDGVRLDGDSGPGGTGVVAMGSLPFDPTASGVLAIPHLLVAWRPGERATWLTQVVDGPDATTDPLGAAWDAARDVAELATGNSIVSHEAHPSAAACAAALRRCIDALRTGTLEKVVLARFVAGRCRAPIDAAALAAMLHRLDPACDLYAYPDGTGRFVGASPELVVATADGAVAAHPLAGTVRLGDGDEEAQVRWLLDSAKNRAEHAVVVDEIVSTLAPLCEVVHAAATPSVVRLSTNARLGTWVDGKLLGRRDASTAVRVLAALHPTPAVGGLPRAAALRVISELEAAPRGPWAGPVGWVDADGTSVWTLGLRAVRADGDRFTVWGGAGIVAASEPDDELAEIDEKLASVLRVLDA